MAPYLPNGKEFARRAKNGTLQIAISNLHKNSIVPRSTPFTSKCCLLYYRKVIGARWFNKGYAQLTKTDQKFTPPECMEYLSARDAIGHGSHTASIASGSPVDSVNIQGFEVGSIQGVAFGARLAIYKVCWCNKNGPIWPNAICSSVDILAAMEAAVADGVDIISASLGQETKLSRIRVLTSSYVN